MKFIPYGQQWIDEDDIQAVVAVLRSDWLTQGPAIERFEQALADYCGAKYAVVFNSGTAALHGAYFALGLGAGNEFITSPITFAATANAGLYLGARPVFADVESDTGNIDPAAIEEKITAKTKLIVPVHYSGIPANMREIYDTAKRHSLFVVEDACHALGASYDGGRIGCCGYSDMAVFSFHPVKHITTGEGGAVLTNNRELSLALLKFRTHGITKTGFMKKPDGDWHYEMHALGYNYRMTDIQAALGTSQLKKIEGFVRRRRALAKYYDNAFKNSEYFELPPERNRVFSSYHFYPIRLHDRLRKQKTMIFSSFRNAGLGVQVHYIPTYYHPYYTALGYAVGLCPRAEVYYEREISLPLFPAMTDDDATAVVDRVMSVLKNS